VGVTFDEEGLVLVDPTLMVTVGLIPVLISNKWDILSAYLVRIQLAMSGLGALKTAKSLRDSWILNLSCLM
jgi:hypothetical protein